MPASSGPPAAVLLLLVLLAAPLPALAGPARAVSSPTVGAGTLARSASLPSRVGGAPLRPAIAAFATVWTNLTTTPVVTGPGPRYGAAMAYDVSDAYSVLFGGYTPGFRPYLNDTWTWSHGAWVNASRSSGGAITGAPSGRLFPSMAYDPALGKLLMFGGYFVPRSGPPHYLDDTWTFSNGAWTNITAGVGTPPEGRWAASMAYDPVSQTMVLFGGGIGSALTGSGSTAQQETWTFHNGTWTNDTASLGSAQPPARDEAAFAWDNSSKELVLYGGQGADGGLRNDTWTYAGGTWSNITSGSAVVPDGTPWGAGEGLRGAVLVPDAVDGTLVLFGGSDLSGQLFIEGSNATYLFRNNSWSDVRNYTGTAPEGVDTLQDNPNGPFAPAATWDAATGAVLVYGGEQVYSNSSSGIGAYTWAYRWSNVSTDLTANRTQVPFGQGVTIHATTRGGTWTYRWAYIGLPTGCLSANLSTISCLPAATGPFTVRVYGNDSAGATSEANLTLYVYRPLAPMLSAWPSVVDVGDPVYLNTTVGGGAQGSESYTYDGLPSICAGAHAADVQCAPDETGTYSVNVTVTDAVGNVAVAGPALFQVYPRLLVGLRASRAAVDGGEELAWNATPGGGFGFYYFAWSGLPPGCLATDSSNISCLVSSNASGRFPVTVTLSDGTPYSVLATTTVEVFPALTASIGTAPPGGPAPLNVSLTAEVSGGDPPVTTAWTISEPGLPAGSESDVGSLSLELPSAGNYTVELDALDALGTLASVNETIVVAAERQPLAVAIGVVPTIGAVDLGENVTFLASASGGVAGGASYSYDWAPVATGCTPAGATLTCHPTLVGSLTATVNVTDSVGTSRTASRTVSVVPSLTLILSQPLLTAGCGPQTEQLQAAALGGTPPYSYAWTFPDGSGASGTRVTYYFAAPGNYTVRANATDGTGNRGSATFDVYVAGCPGPNGPSLTEVILFAAGASVIAAGLVNWAIYRRRPPGAEPDVVDTGGSSPEPAPEVPEPSVVDADFTVQRPPAPLPGPGEPRD